MTRRWLVVTLMIAGMALAPATVLAGRDHSGRGGDHGQSGRGGDRGHSGRGGERGRDGGGHGFRGGHGVGNHHGKGQHGFKHRQGFGFFPVVTLYVPPLYYGYGYGYPGYGYGYQPTPPPVYYSPAYVPPPTVYPVPSAYVGNAATVSVAPTEPAPRVIEYPNGRFELIGDGITSAHTWVWIPNPPAAPPESVPTPPAPPRETPRTQPASGEGTAPRLSPVYRWTDEQGVLHLTNRPDAVPRSYGAQPRRAPTL